MRRRHNYKNLNIWKLGLQITFDISDIIEKFPKHEIFGLTSQMSRCSVSMPSNISEGSARTNKAFNNYLDISLGSSFKLGTQLLVAHHKKYINAETLETLEAKISEWQKMTMGFQNGLSD